MTTAVILLKVENKHLLDISEEIMHVDGVQNLYSVTGKYDYVVIWKGYKNEELEESIGKKLLKINGIVDSQTLVAFKQFSKDDMYEMFSIGFENNQHVKIL